MCLAPQMFPNRLQISQGLMQVCMTAGFLCQLCLVIRSVVNGDIVRIFEKCLAPTTEIGVPSLEIRFVRALTYVVRRAATVAVCEMNQRFTHHLIPTVAQ